MLRSLQFSARFSRVSYSQNLRYTAKFAAQPIFLRKMSHGESTVRPQPDKVLVDIAEYVHNYKIDSELAYETARLCLIDTIGCGLEGLRFKECARLMGPVVEGTIVPNGPL
jgi:2-methylcitrate dehydratase